MNDNQRLDKLVEVLRSYAPEEWAFDRYLSDLKQYNNLTIRYICGSIYDGVVYGNWPWSNYAL
jgi:hypothetical protein